LLSIDELKDRDLAGRVLWTGVELTPEEAEIVRKRAINAEGEATARACGHAHSQAPRPR